MKKTFLFLSFFLFNQTQSIDMARHPGRLVQNEKMDGEKLYVSIWLNGQKQYLSKEFINSLIAIANNRRKSENLEESIKTAINYIPSNISEVEKQAFESFVKYIAEHDDYNKTHLFALKNGFLDKNQEDTEE